MNTQKKSNVSNLSLNNKKNKYFSKKNILNSENDLNLFSFKSSIPIPGNTPDSDSHSIWLVQNVGITGTSGFNNLHDTQYDNTLVWDLFNTNQIFVNQAVMNKVNSANDVIPLVYYTNVVQNLDLSVHTTEHGEIVSVKIPGGDSIFFERYREGNIDGWLTYFEHGFNLVQFVSGEQLEFSFDTDSIKNDLLKGTKLVNKDLISKEMSSKNMDELIAKLSKNFTSLKSMQVKNNTSTQDIIGENMNTSCPSCVYYTYKNSAVKIDIRSKDYKYANIIEGLASCSHPKLQDSEKVTYCQFSALQSKCPMYEANHLHIKDYFTTGANSVNFKVIQEIDQYGAKKVSIYNAATNELSYCLYPPSSVTDEEIIQEVDSLVKEVVSSWPSEVIDTLTENVPAPIISKQKEKKSFILSLV